jgi:hypothetical protein
MLEEINRERAYLEVCVTVNSLKSIVCSASVYEARKQSTSKEDEMARAPMKLHVKKNQLHKDVGKTPKAKISAADIAKEKSKGGIFAKRAQFAENAKTWNHPGKGKR